MISRPQSTYLVICVVAFSQGVLGLADLAISYMQKEDFKMNPSEMTYIQGIISLPWVVKPLWGLCTDFIPLFGYRRKSYLFIFGILGFCAYNALAIYGTHNPTIGVLLLLSIQTCIAFCNVVGEALLVEESKDKKSTKNVSLFFGIRAFGTLVTSYLSGYCLKILTKTQIFQITSVFPLIISLTSLILVENPTPTKSSQQIKDLKNFINIPEIHQPIIFIFLFMLNPSISTAMFYFNTLQLHYTADFMGQLKFLYALATIWSVWFYNKHLKQVEFKKMFLFSALAYSAVNSLNVILVTRANLKYGIRDEVFSLLDTVLVQTVAELNMLPILVLSCKICPPKIEGTMYALLMSTINLGQLIAKQIGGILMYFLGISDKNFDNLWILITIASVYVLIPLPFLRIIKEKEMLDIKEKYEVPEMFDDYERISLSFVEK